MWRVLNSQTYNFEWYTNMRRKEGAAKEISQRALAYLARIVRKSVRLTPLVGKSVAAGSKRLTETAAALKFVTLDC